MTKRQRFFSPATRLVDWLEGRLWLYLMYQFSKPGCPAALAVIAFRKEVDGYWWAGIVLLSLATIILWYLDQGEALGHAEGRPARKLAGELYQEMIRGRLDLGASVRQVTRELHRSEKVRPDLFEERVRGRQEKILVCASKQLQRRYGLEEHDLLCVWLVPTKDGNTLTERARNNTDHLLHPVSIPIPPKATVAYGPAETYLTGDPTLLYGKRLKHLLGEVRYRCIYSVAADCDGFCIGVMGILFRSRKDVDGSETNLAELVFDTTHVLALLERLVPSWTRAAR